jgi:hypothetical protein
MAFFKDLQQSHISINKPIKSKIENLKPFLRTVNLISNKSLAIKAKAKYKIERNYLSLLVAAFSLTIPISIVGCSQENKTTQNEASAISTEAQSQSVSNTPQKFGSEEFYCQVVGVRSWAASFRSFKRRFS